MQSAAAQCSFLIKQHDGLLVGLEDQHLALEPTPGLKTAGWLVGHMVVTGDFARSLCGLSPMINKNWRRLFSPDTVPSPDSTIYPPMTELVNTFRSVYQDLAKNSPNASIEMLSAHNPYEPGRKAFPTTGDFARYLLTGHLGYHLGQLSIWRSVAAVSDSRLRRS